MSRNRTEMNFLVKALITRDILERRTVRKCTFFAKMTNNSGTYLLILGALFFSLGLLNSELYKIMFIKMN